MGDTAIDWDKLTGQQAAPAAGMSIDWSKLPTLGGDEHNPQTGTIGPDQHPFEHRMNELVQDAKFGPGVNDDRLPERAMRAVGFHGTETGGQGGVGAAMPIAGAVEGIPELIHAASRVPQVKTGHDAISVANEGMGGAMSTLAGAAPLFGRALPMVVPSVATGGAAGKTAGATAGFFGAEPDTQELISNAAAIAVPGVHGLGEPGGRALQTHAPALGEAAGVGTAALSFGKNLVTGGKLNPLDLLFASNPATKTATSGIRAGGKAMESLGSIPFRDPNLPALDSTPGTTAVPPLISRGDIKPTQSAGEVLPPNRQLPRGPIQMPAPAEEPTHITQPAQSQLVRNANTGRMTKQFLTGTAEPGAKPRYGSEPPLIQTFGEPQAPPAAQGTSRQTAEGQTASRPAEPATATYLDQLNDTISEYQKILEMNPGHEDAQAALKDLTDLRDEVSQPGYKNPLIDPNAPAQSNGGTPTTGPEVVPSPNGTATDTSPGVNKPVEIPVQKLENGTTPDNAKRNEPYEPVPKRPRETFEEGPQLIDTGNTKKKK